MARIDPMRTMMSARRTRIARWRRLAWMSSLRSLGSSRQNRGISLVEGSVIVVQPPMRALESDQGRHVAVARARKTGRSRWKQRRHRLDRQGHGLFHSGRLQQKLDGRPVLAARCLEVVTRDELEAQLT